MRASVQAILPEFKVVDAKVTGNLKTEIRHTAAGAEATASFVGKISVKSDSRQILTHENYVRPFTVQLRKQDGRWLMTEYETEYAPRGSR